MTEPVIRLATPSDHASLRAALVELHETERSLSDTRLPGEETADAYLAWMLEETANGGGAVLVAAVERAFAGFAAGWVVEDDYLEETPDSNRYGLVSDVCVLPAFRRLGLATKLLDALEARLAATGVSRIRLSAVAGNAPARSAYERAGYEAYEVVYEKRVRGAPYLNSQPAPTPTSVPPEASTPA
jgi:ribosomal protein S18 acetylase RimI-like enzyme